MIVERCNGVFLNRRTSKEFDALSRRLRSRLVSAHRWRVVLTSFDNRLRAPPRQQRLGRHKLRVDRLMKFVVTCDPRRRARYRNATTARRSGVACIQLRALCVAEVAAAARASRRLPRRIGSQRQHLGGGNGCEKVTPRRLITWWDLQPSLSPSWRARVERAFLAR